MPGRHSLKQLFGGDVRREKANYVIQSVSHALDVLEQFAGDAEELGVTELSKRLRLHKNNVFRLLATLESRGYIEQNRATENYRLGVRCLQLGQSYVDHMGLLRQARPIMAELVRQARETTYLAVLRRAAVVPVEVIEAARAHREGGRAARAQGGTRAFQPARLRRRPARGASLRKIGRSSLDLVLARCVMAFLPHQSPRRPV